MANEFIIRKGYKSLAASEVTGSLTTTGNIVGKASGYLQRLYIQDKKALDSSSNFLYIDPNTEFSSGIYINNAVRIDGGLLGSYNEDLQLRTGTTTRITIANADGAVRFHNYGAGYLKTDSSGNITVDTSTVEDTLQSVTDRGASTTNAITINKSSESTYFTGGSGGVRQLSITSGTNTSAHALHTFNIASTNGKYEFDVNGTTEFSLDSTTATFAGSLNVGPGPSRFTDQQNAGSRLELYNNRQDAGNVEVYRIAAYNAAEVTGVHFYRGGGSSSGYTKIFSKKNNASSLEQVVQFGQDNSLATTFAGQITTTQNQITTSIGTTSAIRLKPGSTTNTTGKSSIFLGTSPVDNYGISLRGARLGSDGTPTFEIATHNNSANGTVALSIDNSQNATFAGDVDVNGGQLKIQGDFAKLLFEDTAGTDLDSYIVNNANGLFFGKTNSPSASNDILSLDLSTKAATFAGDLMMLSGTGGTTDKIIFKRTDNTSEATFIRTNAYWNEYGAHANEGHKFIDSSGNILLQLNGGNSSTGNGTLSATFAGDARFNSRVRIGDVSGLSNRGTVRIDTRGDAPADLLFGRDTAGTATSWNGVYWALSSRNSGQGDKFTIYRGTGHASPYNSEAIPFQIEPNLNATFAGDVTVAGTITAQEFHTEFVSASIIYESGSTKFGDTVDDTHDFTGSINLQAQSGATGIQIDRSSTIYMNLNNSSTRNEFNFKSPSGLRFYYGTDSTTPLFISSSGNVGIGTTAPDSLLTIHKDNTSGQFATYRNNTGFFLHRTYADYNNDGTTVEYQERVGVDGNYTRIGNFSNHPLYLMSNNDTKVTILTNGKVGIGTTSPTEKLHVNGDSRFSGTIEGDEATTLIKDVITDQTYEGTAYYNPETLNAFAGADKWATITLSNAYSSNRTSAVTSLGANPFMVGGNTSQIYFDTSETEIVIEIDHTTEPLRYHGIVGIQFTNTGWRAERVKIEGYNGSAWTTGLDTTTNVHGTVAAKLGLGSAGVQKTKITLGNPANSSGGYMRISKIFGYDYKGVSSYDAVKSGTYYLEKFVDNGHYSNIYPAVDSTYNLGTSGLRYANIYADTLHGSVTTATTASNAMLLDGIDSTAFLRSNVDDTMTGVLTFSKENASPSITFHNGGNDMATNAALAEIDFTADYQGSSIPYGSIQLKTNASSVRADMDFIVKSTSGNQETALKLQGGSGKPKSFFYNDMSVEGQVSASSFIGDGSGLTGISTGPNYYLTGLSFATGTGVLTATVDGASNPTIDLDGRYRLDAGSELPNTTDLDTLTTTGIWAQNSNNQTSTANNYPDGAGFAGIIENINDPGNNQHTSQMYFRYNGNNDIYHRYRYDTTNGTGGWSGWAKIWTTRNDGPTSGLAAQTAATATTATTASNAMLLDGLDSTSFLRSDESDTMSGNLSLEGNLLLTGTATTTNQGRMIDFTGFDKEGTTDFTDRAYIQHTTNTGGHAGSVLVISSQNDSGDGIAFLTNASSNLKHNSNTIWTSGNDGPTSGLAAQTAATATSASNAGSAPYSGLYGTVPTWNQDTTGTAAQANNLNATDDRDMAPEDYGYTNDLRIFFSSKEGLEAGSGTGTNYQDVLYLNSYTDSSGGDANILAFDKSEKKIYHYQADQAATNWGTAKQLAYTDSDITGTAATATTASNAMLLDGFDSTAFPRKAEDATISGHYNFTGTSTKLPGHFYTNRYDSAGNVYFHVGTADGVANTLNLRVYDSSNSVKLFSLNGGTGAISWNGSTIWHAGNDGPTSGLAAQTAATASYYVETDTLATVTGRGSSTTNAITIGPSATAGGRLLSQTYSGTDRLGVFSSYYSSGNLILGYGLEGKSGATGYVSTYDNFSGRHGAIEIFGTGFKFVGDSSNSQTTVGTAITTSEFFNLTSGNLTLSGDLTINGGNIAVNNNNGGIQFNDVSSYWTRTATNWGIYWNTSSNQLQFHGAGTSRAFIDLDTGRIQGNEHGIFANNVYAGGTEGFVFGSSTSEGEYIKRVGNDIQFVAGGSFRMVVDGDNTRVGIGTASPGKALDVHTNTNTDGIRVQGSATNLSLILNQTGTGGQAWDISSIGGGHGHGQGKLLFNVGYSATPTLSMLHGSTAADKKVGIGTHSPTANLQVIGSGSTVFDVQGSQGQLFSITDDLTGDLFSVSDISGVPILNVNASGDSYFDGNLDISGSLKVTGSAFFNGSMVNAPAETPGVHIGVSTGGDGQVQIMGSSAHVDFANAASEDYDMRIILQSNDELGILGGNLDLNSNSIVGINTLQSTSTINFLNGSSAQTAKFKSIQVSTSYSGTIPNNGILFYTDTNLYRSAANLLKTDDSFEVDGRLYADAALTVTQAASDQNTAQDSGTIPSTGIAEMIRFQGGYTNGLYTTELVKVDRSGNLPLYFRQSKGTADSFTNLIRIGDHGQTNGTDIFAVFGNARVDGTLTAASVLDVGNYLRTDEIRAIGGQDLTITAGECYGTLNKSTHNDEVIRLAGEGGVIIYASSDNLTSGLNRQTKLIDSSGNAAFGQITSFSTGGTARITSKTAGTGNSGVALSMGTSNTNMSYVRQNGNGVFQWQTYNSGNSGQLHFQPYGGNVGIGSSSPSAKLDVNGDLKVANGSIGINVTPSTTDGRLDASNDVVAYSTSDRRLKENIIPISDPLNKINKINGVEFDWIPLTDREKRVIHGNEGHDVGVIAQEIEDILPVAVKQREHSKYKAVRYEKIIPLLIEGMKEQQKQIEDLKAIVNKLQNEK